MVGGQTGSDTVVRRMTSGEIADDLAERIRGGQYQPGQKLDFTELAELYGVPQSAIKRAMALLRFGGVVVYQPGRGNYVADG